MWENIFPHKNWTDTLKENMLKSMLTGMKKKIVPQEYVADDA